MLKQTYRAAESRIRRLARKEGYCLHKSRMAVGIDNQGGYRVVDPNLNCIMAGERFDLDQQEVIDWLVSHQSGRLAHYV